MKMRALLLVSLGMLLGADVKDDPKQDLEKFQGSWTAVSYTVDGKPASDAEVKSIKLSVKGNMSTFSRSGQTGKGAYKLDPAKKPKELDILVTDGPDKGKTMLAIYEFEGEGLRIAIGTKDRPKEFSSKPGSGQTLEVWKRAKP